MVDSVVGSWPAVAYEQRTWEPAREVRDSFGPLRASSGPYRAAVVPLLEDRAIPLSTETTTFATDATAELIRFDTEHARSPLPLAELLLFAEGTSSSAIERVTSTAQAIALAQIDESLEPAAGEIAGNIRAVAAAIERAGSLGENMLVDIQRMLTASTRPERRGRWRDQQVWIGGGANAPYRAAFVPPHQTRVADLMADLMQFARRRDLPALAHIAVCHAQYETIHPFLEVNGRTGRAFMQAMLRRADITRSIAVPLSAGLLQDTAAYFDALTRYRSGHVDPIVAVFSRAAFTAVANSNQLVDDLTVVEHGWAERNTSREGSAARRLTALLQYRPVVNARAAIHYLGVTAPNVQLAIDRLVDDGILTQIGSGRRNRTWAARGIIDALDAFSERTRRGR